MKLLEFDDVLASLQQRGSCYGEVDPTVYHAMKPQLEEALGCPVVSKSTLADFMANPYRFKCNQEQGVRKSSESLALGSLVDCLTLTPELFDQQYLCEPVRVQLKKDGTPYADGRQDPAQKAEWQAKAEAGITVISEEQLARAKTISELATDSLKLEGLMRGHNYTTQVGMWVYLTELAGHELACPVVITGMLDICPTQDTLWDLKTTSVDVGNAQKIMYTMEDFHYGMQAALYVDLWRLCSGEDEERSFNFMFVGTVEPLMSRSVFMTAEAMELYRIEYAQAVADYCIAWKLDEWGTPQQEDIFFTPSAREYKRIGRLEGRADS